jgi:hypothetical protein
MTGKMKILQKETCISKECLNLPTLYHVYISHADRSPYIIMKIMELHGKWSIVCCSNCAEIRLEGDAIVHATSNFVLLS